MQTREKKEKKREVKYCKFRNLVGKYHSFHLLKGRTNHRHTSLKWNIREERRGRRAEQKKEREMGGK
jgi:hypothetical protein